MILKQTDFREKKLILEKKKQNRKGVLFLFLITVVISCLLWAGQSLKSWWQNFYKPTSYKIESNDKSLELFIGFKPDLKDNEGVKKSINLIVSKLAGKYGFYFYDLKTTNSIGLNENEVFIAASVNKVPIMVNFYKLQENGKVNENDIYVLKYQDIQDYGTGQMRYQPVGTEYKYSDLINLIGKKSDNTAAYVLEELIGQEKIQASLDKLKMTNTSMKNNTTTPKEMGDYFVWLYEDKLLEKENKEKIFKALQKTDFEDRISQGIPDVDISHKIGNEIQTYNDCGIIFGSKPSFAANPYVLCILTKEVSETEALKTIPKISKLLWEYINK